MHATLYFEVTCYGSSGYGIFRVDSNTQRHLVRSGEDKDQLVLTAHRDAIEYAKSIGKLTFPVVTYS